MIKKLRVIRLSSSSIIFFIILYTFCGAAFAGQNMSIAENNNSYRMAEKQTNPVVYPVKLFKKYISEADGNRCQMYPSCSKYCIEAFNKHGSLLGWIMCCDRLVRCGRDEVKLSAPVFINGEKRSYDPVSNNDFWW